MALHLADRYEGFVLDVDGVVYRQGRDLPGARDAIVRLMEERKKVVFASNSSTHSRSSALERLRNVGLSVSPEQVVVGTEVAARAVADQWPDGRAYVFGNENLAAELQAAGITVVSDPATIGYGCDCVVVGNDLSLNYERLQTALRVLLAGAKFVAVNKDRLTPVADGFAPAPGGFVAALAYMSGREPDLVAGKPGTALISEAMARIGTSRENTLIIGDTIESDIVGGLALGLRTAVVLTGNTTAEQLRASEVQPHYVLETLRDLWSGFGR